MMPQALVAEMALEKIQAQAQLHLNFRPEGIDVGPQISSVEATHAGVLESPAVAGLTQDQTHRRRLHQHLMAKIPVLSECRMMVLLKRRMHQRHRIQ